MTICDKVLRAIRRYGLLEAGDRVLLGVSGGQDSVTLALILAELAQELQVELVVGHLHHGLRGAEADADAAAVGQLTQELGLPFVCDRADVAAVAAGERVGLEEAGRLARYRFFEAAAREQACNRIALGHTATDRAETLLMNLFRGAGLHGLRSIPPRRGAVIRPLILLTRQETADYCRIRGITVCSDAYNAAPEYLRNRLRAELLPQLEREYGPGLAAALCRTADHLYDELEWTEPLVAEALAAAAGEGQALSAAALRAMPDGLRYRVLRLFLQQQGIDYSDISEERWQAVGTLIDRGVTGRKAELSHGRHVQLEYDSLRVTGAQTPAGQAGTGGLQAAQLVVPGRLELPSGTIVEAQLADCRPLLPAAGELRAVLDYDRAGALLQVRDPRPGDRFTPLGMCGRKKLQDYFVDNKVPAGQRCPLLVTDREGEILWVVGHRLAEVAKVGDETRRYLILSVSV